MSAEQNRELVKRREQMWNNRDLAMVDQIFAADYRGHTPHKEVKGREEVKRFVRQMQEAFPDFEVVYDPVVTSEDHVAVLATVRGTHENPFAVLEPTGNEVNFTAMLISRVEQGKIVEEWRYIDTMTLLEQLGIELGSDDAEQILFDLRDREERPSRRE